MTQVRRRLSYIFLKADSVQLALISGLAAFLFGLVLAIPAGTFTTSGTYEAMSNLMSETIWGVLFVLLGFWQVVVTFFNYHWRLQAYSNLLMMFLWLFIAIMIIISNPLSTGIAVYPTLTAVCFGRFYRCYQDKERL